MDIETFSGLQTFKDYDQWVRTFKRKIKLTNIEPWEIASQLGSNQHVLIILRLR